MRRRGGRNSSEHSSGSCVLALRELGPSAERWAAACGMRVSAFRPLGAWSRDGSMDYGGVWDCQSGTLVATLPVHQRGQAYNLDARSVALEGWVGSNVDWAKGLTKDDKMHIALRQHGLLEYASAMFWLVVADNMRCPWQETRAVGGQASLLRCENLSLQNENAELKMLVEILRTTLDAKKRQLEEAEQGLLRIREERLMEGVQMQLVLDENWRLETELDAASDREHAAIATIVELEERLKVR
jgi:hypothetical protein